MSENYTLINFNMPKSLKEDFDKLSKQKHVSKTAILNGFIEEFCRIELRKLQEDQKLKEALTSASLTVTNLEPEQATLAPPAIPSMDDEYDWEERFRL